jgi:hypothetical protein
MDSSAGSGRRNIRDSNPDNKQPFTTQLPMAGFFKQFLSLGPSNGLCTRIATTFVLEMRKPGMECYLALMAAWKDAIQTLKREPSTYQNHLKLYESGIASDVCKAFAAMPHQEIAPWRTGKIFASLCYPAFGQVPQVKEVWGMLIGCARTPADDSALLNRRFSSLNPKCYLSFFASGEEPFSSAYAQRVESFALAWVAANDVRW